MDFALGTEEGKNLAKLIMLEMITLILPTKIQVFVNLLAHPTILNITTQIKLEAIENPTIVKLIAMEHITLFDPRLIV